MRPTISDLRRWDPNGLSIAADAAQQAAQLLDHVVKVAIRSMDDADSWMGVAHRAANSMMSAESRRTAEVRTVLTRIADEARDAGADLGCARDCVLRHIDAALDDGFRVSDTGQVAAADDLSGGAAATIAAQISDGLNVLDHIDEFHGARLDDLAEDLFALVDRPGTTAPSAAGDPHRTIARLRSMTPVQRRELLSHMTADERRRVVLADPQTIGNLDGVDFDIRADANEINIRAALEEERRAGRGDGARARRLEEFLRPHADGSQRRFVAFDNTPNGHFIEMIGEFRRDTRFAAVVVPGAGTDLDNSDAKSRAAEELARRTNGPVFLYLDGDLPQALGFEGLGRALGTGAMLGTVFGPPGEALGFAAGVADSIDGSAADPDLARAMAPRLVAFGAELDAEIAEHAPTATTTFIGHSYGGAVVGSAEQLGLRADRVAYASAAGTGAFDGPWRNPDPDVERFSMTAPGDPIQYVQSLPGNPLGDDPDTAPGVVRMDTGFHGPDAAGHRDRIEGFSGHGDYWDDPDSDAFANLVKVIVGEQPSPYVERRPDGAGILGDLLGDGIMADLRDGDIDLPGPIPDIPLRLPW